MSGLEQTIALPLNGALGGTGGRFAGFSARLTTNATNFAGDAAYYTVICNGELYDVGSGYDNTTGIFTVPANCGGIYKFSGQALLLNLAATHTESTLVFTVNGVDAGLYSSQMNPFVAQATSAIGFGLSLNGDISLAASDTVRMRLYLGTAGKTATLAGNNFQANQQTWFSGARIASAS